MFMSLITILLAITGTVMVSIQTDEASEEVRLDVDKFLQSEVARMSKMDVVNAEHAKAMARVLKAKAKAKAKPHPTAVKEEMVQQIQDDKPAKKAGPSLMTVASEEYRRDKKSQEDDWMDDDEDDDKDLAMPSVTKEGDVAMFQEHESSRSRSLDRLLNGNKRKLSEKKMDSFSASLLGDVAPKKPKRVKPRIHLSRLMEPRSTRIHIHQHHKKKLLDAKKQKQQAQHKKKDLKKMNKLREHMKSFWAQVHPPKKKVAAPKPVAKPKHVVCKPPTCLPRGHHYEHPHGAAANSQQDQDPLSVLEQAYPNKKIKKVKKKVSIWDKADPLAKDLVSSAPVAVALGATIASAHRRKAPRTIEDIIDEAPKDAFVQPPAGFNPLVKVVKVAKKVPKAPAKKPAQKPRAAALNLDDENPWETDHFAQKMSNTWHTRNAMANMKMALTNAEHSNAMDAASKMAPKLTRKERIAQKTRMLKKKLQASVKFSDVKKKFNRAFLRRQKAKKAAAKAKKARKKLKKQQQLKKKQAKEAVATHTATSAVETAFANVFDSAWRKQAPKMGQNLPHGPGA